MIRQALRMGVLLVGVVGCTLEPPFDRSNPFDPDSPYEMQLVGFPDTLDARGARIQAIIERDPPLPPGPLAIAWEAIDPTIGTLPGNPPPASSVLWPLSGGEFLVNVNLTAQFVPAAIRARFNDEVIVSRVVIVGQRVRTLSLACGTVDAPTECDATPLSVLGSANVRSTSFDGLGNPVAGLQHAMARAIVTSRNPAVIAPSVTPNAAGTFAVTAAGAGSTWLVITMDFATDSVRFVVNP